MSWVSEAWSRRHINHLHSQNCSAHISGSHHSHSFCCSFPFMNPEKVKEPRSRRRDWSPWKPTEHQQPPLYSCRLFTMAAGSIVSLPPCSSGFLYISLSGTLCWMCRREMEQSTEHGCSEPPELHLRDRILMEKSTVFTHHWLLSLHHNVKKKKLLSPSFHLLTLI